MTSDGRHLRARWIIAAIGWLMWIVTIMLPVRGWSSDRLWTIYPGAVRAVVRGELQIGTILHATMAAALVGLIAASCVLAISPVLMRLNHNLNPSVRRWRWVGLGLLATVELSVVFIMAQAPLWSWPIHLFVLAHIVVCAAILPWPREQLFTQSGFDVIIPDPKPTNTKVTTDAHR